jgi:hypothetical protein
VLDALCLSCFKIIQNESLRRLFVPATQESQKSKCGDCSGCLKASVCCLTNDTGQQIIKKNLVKIQGDSYIFDIDIDSLLLLFLINKQNIF